jgi:hypothetical protein
MRIENEGQPIALPTTFMRSPGGPCTLDVRPVLFQDLGKYQVTVTATDGVLTTTVSFVITIFNTAPYLQNKFPKKHRVQLTKDMTLTLPNILDKEDNPVSISFIGFPSFITYNSILSQIIVRPSNPATDLGVFRIKG